MERIDNSTAATSMPTPGAAGTGGYFTNGNPATSVPATVVDQDWFNNVQEELISILTAAGTTPDKTKQNQVLTSLQSLFSPQGLSGRTLGASGNLAAAGTTVALSFTVMRVGSSLKGAGAPLIPSDFTSLNFDVATSGAGGMDTGVSPANTFVAIYGMRNPTTGAAYFIGTTACYGPIYTGTNAGAFTQSALHSIWPTNASGQLIAGTVQDRWFFYAAAPGILSSVAATTWTAVSISSVAPSTVKTLKLNASALIGTAGASCQIAGTSAYPPGWISGYAASSSQLDTPGAVSVLTPGSIYYTTGATNNYVTAAVTAYEIY